MRKRRRCFLLGTIVVCFCFSIYIPILMSIRPEEIEVWNMTRDMRVFLQPNNHTAIISGENLCSKQSSIPGECDGTEQGEDDIFLVVVVCSSTHNFEARNAIRETWGQAEVLIGKPRTFSSVTSTMPSTLNDAPGVNSVSSSPPPSHRQLPCSHSFPKRGDIRLMFMLGRTENATLQQLIYQESDRFNDIVQEDFLDTYNNLTLKSVMLLKWVNSTCPRVRFVMKTDDDTFVNVPRLVYHLKSYGRPKLLLGCLICGAIPVKNKHSKWYVPRVLYNERYYPNYLSGTGYVMSSDVIAGLYAVALTTPFFHLEDVYITGIVAKRLKIKPVDFEGFTYQKRPRNPCLFHLGITGHRVTPSDMRAIWKEMQAPELHCDPKKIKLRDFRTGKCR